MKRAVIIVPLAVAVIGATLPYAPVDFLKSPIERALARSLGRKVEVDQVSLTLFSGPGVSLDGVTIHEDSRAGIEPFAYASTLDARLNPLALLRGHLEFSSLNLNDATFNLVKPADAPWNFQMLLNPSSSGPGRHASLPPAAALPSIKMRGGRVNFKFAQTKSVLYFDDTDLDVAPDARGAVELRFSGVPARTDRSAQNFGHFFVRGTAVPSAAGEQFNLRVELEPSALDAVARLFESVSAGLNGAISLDAQLTGPASNLDVKGILQLEGAGQWRVGYKGKLDLAAQTLELDSISPAGLNTKLHAATRDLLTTPRWEVSADFLDAPLGSGIDMARKLGAPLPAQMTAEGFVAGSVRYRNTDGLGGNLEVREAVVTLPNARPLKISTTTLFLKGATIQAGPNTVNIGETDTAEVEATYQAGEGGGVEVKLTTHRMRVADLRALSGPAEAVPEASARTQVAIPLLNRLAEGTCRGALTYQRAWTAASTGHWNGDFEIQNTRIALDGFADPMQIQSAEVSVRDRDIALAHIRAKAGDIAFAGEYRWSADPSEPQRFRLQIGSADAREIERLFQPAISREGGLLARTLRLGAAGAIPDWLTQRHVEGILSIQSIGVVDTRFSVAGARLAWNGPAVTIAAIQGKVEGAALSGELRIDLSGRAPGYRFEGQLSDLPYKGGKLDFTGKLSAAGTGPPLLRSVEADGTLRGRSIAFSSDAEFRQVTGRFALTVGAAGPRWKLSDLEVVQGNDSYSGEGATQADGRIVLDLLSGGRQVHFP